MNNLQDGFKQIDMPSPSQQYDRVVDYLRSAISSRTLKAGDRLPTQRGLSRELGLSLPTVARGFSEAQRLGLITSTVGRGTFVADNELPAEGRTLRLDLTVNVPAPNVIAGVLGDDLQAFAREGGLNRLDSYAVRGEISEVSEAVASWLCETGVDTLADDVTLCEGAHHGVYLALQTACRPGDAVVCEDTTYPGLFAIASALELRLVPVPTGPDGPDVRIIQDASASAGAKAMFLVPTLHNPLGYTLDLDRRRDIARVVRQQDLILIEDDVYRALADNPPVPFASLVPERTIHVGSLSKVLAPGLRLGFLMAPPGLKRRVAALAIAHRYSSSPIPLALALRWFGSGAHRRVAAAHRLEVARRTAVAAELFGLERAPCAYHLWLPFESREDAEGAATELARCGIDVPSTTAFSGPFTPSQWGLRLALGNLPSGDKFGAAIVRVRDALDSAKASGEFPV